MYFHLDILAKHIQNGNRAGNVLSSENIKISKIQSFSSRPS